MSKAIEIHGATRHGVIFIIFTSQLARQMRVSKFNALSNGLAVCRKTGVVGCQPMESDDVILTSLPILMTAGCRHYSRH